MWERSNCRQEGSGRKIFNKTEVKKESCWCLTAGTSEGEQESPNVFKTRDTAQVKAQ